MRNDYNIKVTEVEHRNPDHMVHYGAKLRNSLERSTDLSISNDDLLDNNISQFMEFTS